MTTPPKPGSWLKQKVAEATTSAKQDLGAVGACDTATVERWLQKFGVKYSHLLDLPLVQIDEKRSRQNQAREVAVIDDSVNRYAAALRNGDKFPPVVGYLAGGKVVLIDGNNRDAAHRKVSAGTIKAYVIDPETPSETIHLMTTDANSHHGVTPSLQWRLNQANFLVGIGHSVDVACTASAVSKTQLQDFRRAINAEQRARSLKIHDFIPMSNSAKVKLGALASDPVFIQASRVAIDTSMKVEEIAHFVRDIKACTAEADQITLIGGVAEKRKMEQKAIEALGKPVQIKSPKQGLITGLGKIMHAAPGDIARSVITDNERAELIKRCNEAGERLMEIMIALDVEEAQRVG